MKNFLFPLVLILINSNCLLGRIDIINVSGIPTPGLCTGSISIIATGNAGAFNIKIDETGETYTNIQGEFTINNLCEGDYTLLVTPQLFPSCQKELIASISVDPSLLIAPLNEGPYTINIAGQHDYNLSTLSSSEEFLHQQKYSIDYTISPNPSNGIIRINFNTKFEENSFISFYSNDGKLLLTKKIEQKTSLIEFDLSFLPPGSYFSSVRFSDEKQLVKTFIVR